MPTLQLQELLPFKMQEHLTFTFLPVTFLLKRGSEGNINILTNPENPLYKTNIQLAVRVLKATEY